MTAAGLQRNRAPAMLFFCCCWSEEVVVFGPKNQSSKINAHLGSFFFYFYRQLQITNNPLKFIFESACYHVKDIAGINRFLLNSFSVGYIIIVAS